MASKLTVVAIVGGCHNAVVSVRVECELNPAAFEQWQLDTYNELLAAYTQWRQAYEDWLAEQGNPMGQVVNGDSPERNKQVVREELKRQIIEMLMDKKFDGFDCVEELTSDQKTGPTTKLDEARKTGPMVQFMEQAFEWSNLTYVLYPYYWAKRERWPELLSVQSTDPDFANFLRSGSARTLVSARPGYESEVLFFSLFKRPWGGGPIPLPNDPHYISVAQEIKELTGAPDEGEPGEMWEVRLPTTLVWLDADPSLPKQNQNRRLNGTPSPKLCCGQAET